MDRIKSTAPFTIWLVDDEREIHHSMALGFKKEKSINKIESFFTCGSLLRRADEGEHPEILLLDINLPGMSGIEALPRIRSMLPETRIIMLTVVRDIDTVVYTAKHGVSGYLLKPFHMEELLTACRRALDGDVTMDPEVVPWLIERIPQADPNPREYGLTTAERRVVELLAKGWTNRQIAKSLSVSIPTVKTHLSHIFCKLNVTNRSQLAIKILRERIS